MGLNNTPRSLRLHIGIFGRRNSGKSSLVNAITGQTTSLVSDVAGTTADPVYKPMEIHGLGACTLIDTAGFDDEGLLGEMRVAATREVISKTDVAILLFSDTGIVQETKWAQELKKAGIPLLAVINKSDILTDAGKIVRQIQSELSLSALIISTKTGAGMETIIPAIIRILPAHFGQSSIAGHLVNKGDTVLLVMPQDIQAPKGRLILPQVQTIRDLLDHGCIPVCTTVEQMDNALGSLNAPPKLIITDSQVFGRVYEKKPEASKLTSFSVLFAGYKGDIAEFVSGAAAIDSLTENSSVLIAEACTHAPLSEDIGREQIPRKLREKIGGNLKIEIVAGNDFPADLSQYDLIIHCGACMFNRRYVLSRIEKAKKQNIPITNYGVALAHISGILEKIVY